MIAPMWTHAVALLKRHPRNSTQVTIEYPEVSDRVGRLLRSPPAQLSLCRDDQAVVVFSFAAEKFPAGQRLSIPYVDVAAFYLSDSGWVLRTTGHLDVSGKEPRYEPLGPVCSCGCGDAFTTWTQTVAHATARVLAILDAIEKYEGHDASKALPKALNDALKELNEAVTELTKAVRHIEEPDER